MWGFKASRKTWWAEAGSRNTTMLTSRMASSRLLVTNTGDLIEVDSCPFQWKVTLSSFIAASQRSTSSWRKQRTRTSVSFKDDAIPANTRASVSHPQINSLMTRLFWKIKFSCYKFRKHIRSIFKIPELPLARCLAVNWEISFGPIKFKVIVLFQMMKTEAQQLVIYKLF